MTTPPESRRHEWCFSTLGERPRTARTCSGQRVSSASRREMCGASRLQIRQRVARYPVDRVRGCTPVPASARAFHGRWVETGKTQQNCMGRGHPNTPRRPLGGRGHPSPCRHFRARGRPNPPYAFRARGRPNPRRHCCFRADGGDGLARSPANRGPYREPHRLFDRTECISVLRTRLGRSIDSPLPSPPASASLTREPVRSDR